MDNDEHSRVDPRFNDCDAEQYGGSARVIEDLPPHGIGFPIPEDGARVDPNIGPGEFSPDEPESQKVELNTDLKKTMASDDWTQQGG